MKSLSLLIVLAASLSTSLLSGCQNGPSPEEQTRQQEEAKQTAKQQADFNKSLPPVQNPYGGQ